MSRLFVRASNNYAQNGNAILSGVPISVSIWVYPVSNANDQELFSITDNSAGNSDAIRLECNFTSINVLQFNLRQGGGETTIPSGSSAPSTNTWSNVVGTIDGSKNQSTYLNGSLLGTVSTSNAPSALAVTNIGAYVSNSGANIINPFDGRIAVVGVWNVALKAAEITSLSNGALPTTIRSASLVAYWPMDGLQSPEPDFAGTRKNMTLSGTPALAAGPPVMLFTPRIPQSLAPVIAPSVIFRKTLSQIGGRVGSRQPQGWAS